MFKVNFKHHTFFQCFYCYFKQVIARWDLFFFQYSLYSCILLVLFLRKLGKISHCTLSQSFLSFFHDIHLIVCKSRQNISAWSVVSIIIIISIFISKYHKYFTILSQVISQTLLFQGEQLSSPEHRTQTERIYKTFSYSEILGKSH